MFETCLVNLTVTTRMDHTWVLFIVEAESLAEPRNVKKKAMHAAM